MSCYGNDVVTTPGTTLLSPNYPNNYPDYCDPKLTIDFVGKVSLRFESMDIEYEESCDLDWLEVRDGNGLKEDRIGSKLCGSDIPLPIISSGHTLKLIFHSDDSYNAKGFKIKADIGIS